MSTYDGATTPRRRSNSSVTASRKFVAAPPLGISRTSGLRLVPSSMTSMPSMTRSRGDRLTIVTSDSVRRNSNVGHGRFGLPGRARVVLVADVVVGLHQDVGGPAGGDGGDSDRAVSVQRDRRADGRRDEGARRVADLDAIGGEDVAVGAHDERGLPTGPAEDDHVGVPEDVPAARTAGVVVAEVVAARRPGSRRRCGPARTRRRT